VDRQVLGQRSIGAALPGLAENIALASGEVGLERVAVGHAHGANRISGSVKQLAFRAAPACVVGL